MEPNETAVAAAAPNTFLQATSSPLSEKIGIYGSILNASGASAYEITDRCVYNVVGTAYLIQCASQVRSCAGAFDQDRADGIWNAIRKFFEFRYSTLCYCNFLVVGKVIFGNCLTGLQLNQ